ncbi:hypothetical protein SETIT_3G053900v2 [Setaria italica]|uniref:Uncharacterized protein n=2 Tax=Setaria TaxID=4554 RepID=A0A368QCG6_SETIT|nr:hypothetical protein SETIT_3G053900v2 [Setaria italica]TKW24542.1 hypothetical protein SEVIR_3G057300v2 [Setaria viridis]
MAGSGSVIIAATAPTPPPFPTWTKKLNPNTVAAGPAYTGSPHPKSTRWNPACRLSDTRNRFDMATYGRPRSTSRSAVDRAYSAVTVAFASRTSSTASPSEPPSRASTVTSTAMGTHAFP